MRFRNPYKSLLPAGLSVVLSAFSFAGLRGQAESLTMQVDETYQEMVGFGASLAYYEGWLNAHPKKAEIYQAIFGELSLDILRVRNAFDYDPGMITRVKEYMDAAESALGHPITLYSTSWGPAGYVKSNGTANGAGGTLRYTVNGGTVHFDYAGFAHWWNRSLDEYEANGILPDYITIQNEPDWPADYESCLLRPTETVNATDTIAGYPEALAAVYDTLLTRAKRPAILGPETVGIGYNDVENYINNLDLSKLDGISHHLYHGANYSNPYASTDFAKVGNFHPELPHFMTEYDQNDEDWFTVASLIYKSLFDERAVAYIYWRLVWPDQGLVDIDFPWDTNQWSNPSGFTRLKTFFSFKQYSAFIHPGWKMTGHTLTGTDHASLTFISPSGDSAACVLLNRSTTDSQEIHLDIPGYRIAQSEVFTTSATLDCASRGPVSDSLVSLPPHSVTTVDMRLTAYDPSADTIPPSVPTGLEVTDAEGNSLSIAWDPSTDDLGVGGYTIYVEGVWWATTASTFYTIYGLEGNTDYAISVSAFDDTGNQSETSDTVIGTTGEPDTEPPTVPQNLQVTGSTDTTLSLVWEPSQDNVYVTVYRVYANGLFRGTAFTTAYTIMNLTLATEYEVTVTALDGAANESDPSDPVVVTTMFVDREAPSVPRNLQVTELTNTSLSLEWDLSEDNVYVAGYSVYTNGSWSGTTAINSYTLDGLLPGTGYEVTVAAFDSTDNMSNLSQPLVVTTPDYDTQAPNLEVTEDTLLVEGTVGVVSSEDGMLYLVPEGTSLELSAIREAALDSTLISGRVLAEVTLSGLPSGTYWLLAADPSGNISEPVSIVVLGLGIEAKGMEAMTLYPNPFSRSATLEFHLDREQDLELVLFDPLGRVVRKEILGRLDPGTHHLLIERRALGTGLYHFRLVNGKGAGITGAFIVGDR